MALPLLLLGLLALLAACRTAPPPPPPPADTVVATSDPTAVLDSVSLAPGEWKDYLLSIPAGVRESYDVVYLELGNAGAGAVLELRSATYWLVTASSASAQRFVRGAIAGVPQPVPAPAAAGADDAAGPAGITVTNSCRGPCIIFRATGSGYYARVVNDGASTLTADLHLYGYDLQDDTEPQNDQRANAPVLQAGGAGAIELLGDVDFWLVPADSLVTLEPRPSAGVEPEVHITDAAGLVVAGPHLPGQSFTVCAGESLRVRAILNGSAGAPAASTYFLSAVPQASSICPRAPAYTEVVASLSPNQVLDTQRYGAGESVAFRLAVPSSVRSKQVMYVELDADVDLELRGSSGGAIASSSSRDSFFAGSLALGADAEGGVRPSAISTSVACRGSCVIVEPGASSYRLVVTNRGASRDISLYAYGSDLTDLTEPQNDSPGTSPVLSGTDAGAIETIGDTDFWFLPNGGSVAFDAVAGGIALEAEIVDASGKPVLNSGGPFGSGAVLELFAGEYVRVWARDAQQAAASAESGYFLDRVSAGAANRAR